MYRTRLVLVGMLVAFVAGCSDKKLDDVSIATIGDEELSKADFEAYLKIKRIPNEAGNRLDRAKKTYLERNALAQAIANESLLNKTELEAELRDFRNELLISRYFEKYLADKVSDAAIKEFYKENAEKLKQRKAHVAHIYFQITPAMSEQEKSAKFNKAVETYNKLKGGAAFSETATKVSEDPLTAKKGGEIGWLAEGQMEKTFAEKVFSLKKGETSEPINTSAGYHIVRLLAEPVEDKKDLKEIEGSVRYRIRNEEKTKEMERLLSKVKVKDL